MPIILNANPAPGGPGLEPRWTHSDKDGVGTAYSSLSKVWFTVARGILTEIYAPTIDRPQIRDLQYLVTDGKTFFHEEKRDLESTHEYLTPHALGFRIVNRDPQGRYQIIKEVIAAPHRPCVMIRTKLEADPELAPNLKMYALLAPHLEVGGWGNNGNVIRTAYGDFLAAHKNNTWVVMRSKAPFLRRSIGYVGASDGWQDLADNFQMDWEYDSALNGNIALMGEIDLQSSSEFVLYLAFGDCLHRALTCFGHASVAPFADEKQRFLDQWERAAAHLRPGMAKVTGDKGFLLCKSHSLLLAHEDKRYEGGIIASLSIPWGEIKGDEDLGGYHLVWTRDMYQSASSLLAAGDHETPLRALLYLALTQRSDGGFYQNFWIDGEPYWRGVQLDETAFPVMLAWRLHIVGALQEFDPWPLVRRAACFLIEHGPVTPQERWEEESGLSPSTLAACIAALICAAAMAREHGHESSARFLEEYADFLEQHIEQWTVTTQGTLLSDVSRHFIRINPVGVNDPSPDEDPNRGVLSIKNRPPGMRTEFPAKDIVDAGFLELVRYGIRAAGEPLFEDSLRVVDAVLKVETPFGPCWRRYNHDGYGQQADGAPFEYYGQGCAWPVLTGERGHYELAARRDASTYLRAMERFASSTGLLPEQIWDKPDRPEAYMYFGQPIGGAMPLMWAQAEYLKLVRSVRDGALFDLIPEVAARYRDRVGVKPLEVWKFNRQVRAIRAGQLLRVQAGGPFQLRSTMDEWNHAQDTQSTPTVVGHHFVDIPLPSRQKSPIRFTFYWPAGERWEGRDYAVAIL